MGHHNLLVLSDIHLGSELCEHVRPTLGARPGATERRDRELVSLIDFYRDNPRAAPWRLVIAGDFIDFTGMSLSPTANAFGTRPTAEEELHGLGNAVDHSVYKLRRVADHHATVFASLARFVAAGHELVIVHGNHDVEFHWPEVRNEFVTELERHAPIQKSAVQFRQWFHYEPDRVYIEHGHQYDAYCAHEHVLNPLCPQDPRRSSRSLSDILVRYVVRPTRGMSEAGHEQARVIDYLRFAFQLGFAGLLALAQRFGRAVWQFWAIYRARFNNAADVIALEHERRLERMSRKMQIGLVRMRRLAALQATPLTSNLRAALSGVMVDRLITGFAAPVITLACWLLAPSKTSALLSNGLALAALLALGYRWRKSRKAVDPSNELRERAFHIAKLFPAAFIVMGHTHLPERSAASTSATYVNLGAWAEDDSAEGFAVPAAPTQTHLVVVDDAGQLRAQLLVWSSDHGPVEYAAQTKPRQS